MTGTAKFIPEDGTSVVTTETYRNLPASSPTASYKTRNVVASTGAAMQFYKGTLGEEPADEVNRLTLTETDTRLMQPLTVDSGGTGAKDVATARTNLEVAQAKPSITYTDCYYRKVDDVTEWYNPPTVVGKEYRTTERFNGKPVYTKLINCGKMPINGDMAEIDHGLAATKIVRSICICGDNYPRTFANCHTDSMGNIRMSCEVDLLTIILYCNTEFSDRNTKVQLWYTTD